MGNRMNRSASRDAAAPLLDVRSVSRNYDDGAVCALRDVSFTIERGRTPERLDESRAGQVPILRVLGEGARDDGTLAGRQRAQVGGVVEVLQHELPRRRAVERPAAAEQLLVDDRQAILIARRAERAVEHLGR